MKITDDEREAAYELKWMVESVLFEREKSVLYARVYVEAIKMGGDSMVASHAAKRAIDAMEKAFEPVCEHCREDERVASQAKVN